MTGAPHSHEELTGLFAGFYGKHPHFGDFVTAGLSSAASAHLERWLNLILPELRDGVADTWEAHYDAAPVMRIWIGPALIPEGRGFCGTLSAARDKVGRRFPLLAGVEGAAIDPPAVDPSQDFYDQIDAFLTDYVRGDEDARGLAQTFASAILPVVTPADPLMATDFWAARQDGDAARLWSDVAEADRMRSAAHRTYIWRTAPHGSALYVTDGLPGAAVLAWLMGAPFTPPGQEGA
ncbi:type VI secretion system-associated protein TagF [Loktanella agnita]|uniref:type VI secretion system-associated protein TagF n=1 Tax=Loktanella agnita TaxID=287097 RepID=UPI003986096E